MNFVIKTYESSSGRKPVKEFINHPRKCSYLDAARIKNELKLLGEFGFQRISDSKNIKDIKLVAGLYEMRVYNYRLFFSHCKKNIFMFYHIYKKTDGSRRKQDGEIKTAEFRMIEYRDLRKCN